MDLAKKSLLNKLLNEMDGLKEDADILVCPHHQSA